ncbi:hypothetical protein CHS0354_032355 [Potamilus streckersoni]|uniref:Uncharacterized protein n=1 Tax=Potamilus streckersoni TaxID=2493646 RepID=A0AAE0THD1_9BIVA|nr:hypothetical protein CHS0354_032355 [Potamilus streckersoni]
MERRQGDPRDCSAFYLCVGDSAMKYTCLDEKVADVKRKVNMKMTSAEVLVAFRVTCDIPVVAKCLMGTISRLAKSGPHFMSSAIRAV